MIKVINSGRSLQDDVSGQHLHTCVASNLPPTSRSLKEVLDRNYLKFLRAGGAGSEAEDLANDEAALRRLAEAVSVGRRCGAEVWGAEVWGGGVVGGVGRRWGAEVWGGGVGRRCGAVSVGRRVGVEVWGTQGGQAMPVKTSRASHLHLSFRTFDPPSRLAGALRRRVVAHRVSALWPAAREEIGEAGDMAGAPPFADHACMAIASVDASVIHMLINMLICIT